jgi:Helicase HerA, central domain
VNTPLLTLNQHHDEKRTAKKEEAAAAIFSGLIQADRYVGEVFSVGFNDFVAQVHDSFRRDVGGISQGAFLIATRVAPGVNKLSVDAEDSEIVLLRVMGPTSLPRDGERQDQRADAVSRAMQGDSAWETEVDEYTHNNLSFSGLKCRVLGTVYIEEIELNDKAPDGLQLRLGTDIDNFYSGRGMKIYKPSADALKQLVNYRDPEFRSDHPLGDHTVTIASLRYGSTRRNINTDAVDINITPADLIGQKTALFGMTRSGKSNTTKIIAQAIYELRRLNPSDGRIGQLIFDPNGEYANENVQDGTSTNPSAIKNIYKHFGLYRGDEVATYGTLPHPLDPDRILMKINVFGDLITVDDLKGVRDAKGADAQAAQEQVGSSVLKKTEMLVVGKSILNELLRPYRDTKYIGNFIGVDLTPPDMTMFEPADAYGQGVRYIRHLLVYRTLLAEGGLSTPYTPNIKNLFNAKLLAAMRGVTDIKDVNIQQEMGDAANILDPKVTSLPNWSQLTIAFRALDKFLRRSEYAEFNKKYSQGKAEKAKGQIVAEEAVVGDEDNADSSWHDDKLLSLLEMFRYSNGPRLAGRLGPSHAANTDKDYSDMIYEDLMNGKLVILDQSLGEELANRTVAERIVWKILRTHLETFGQGKPPKAILVYVEEAHNLLPKKSADGEVNIWARLAKEGAKLNLGLVYATQEVSALQSNILKNTSNWFIAHLNNSEKIREISKYYDFEDFADSIQRSPNKGFIRMRTRTNVFTIPVQIRKFDLATSSLPGVTAPVQSVAGDN